MVSITRYISENFLDDLDQRLQKTALAGKIDRANDRIDNFLNKSTIGRAYMKAENKTGDLVNKSADLLEKGTNKLLNVKDRLLRRNFKVRK